MSDFVRGPSTRGEASTQRKQVHRGSYNANYSARARKLASDAKERARDFVAKISAPIAGFGPFGTFPLAQLLGIEFALHLPEHVSQETLLRDHSTINASAVQQFAVLLKADKAFPSVQSLRLRDEPAISDYAGLHIRAQHAASEVATLLAWAKAQERARHPRCAAVRSLPLDAPLLAIVRAAALAGAPRLGRPRLSGHDGDNDELSIARNWAEGGYTVGAMEKRAQFDARRINISQKETQGDVLEGAGLIINGAPSSVAELRMFKPSKRKVHLAHATTARLHAAQLDVYHSRLAATVVLAPFLQWDEGTAGTFSTGVPGLVAGVTGMFPDDDGEPNVPYQDMLGLEILPNKLGRTVAAGLIRILLRRGFNEIYFVGTDAVTSNVGHASGAIAYLRRDMGQLLIFAIRCLAHIISRTLRHVLSKINGAAGRPGLKRKAEEPTIDREILLVEDACYVFKKWPEVRVAAEALQQEKVPPIRGCIDTRFEYSAHALKEKIGSTAMLVRLERLWMDVTATEGNAAYLKQVQLKALQAAIENAPWLRGRFDFSDEARAKVGFDAMLDAYRGAYILPQLDLLARRLNPSTVSFAVLEEADASLDLPSGCPLSHDTVPSKLPRFLLDLGDVKLRVDCAISEVIGARYFIGHLHFVELRRPGIFFEAHDEIEYHRSVARLFGDNETPWSVDAVAKLSPPLARALDFVLRYARSHEDTTEGLEVYAHARVDAKMASYSDYYNEQTAEWFSNPALVVGRLGSIASGPEAARWLVGEGTAELVAALAGVLHCDSAAVRTALQSEHYDGPLQLLAEDTELWAELVAFSEQNLSLWAFQGAPTLRALIRLHYTPLRIANVWMEELVKDFKNLTPQARAHPIGAEVRMCTNARTRPSQLPPPSLSEMKEIRRGLGHHLPNRARARPAAPVAENELDEIVWQGVGTSEDGFSSDHEQEEDAVTDDDDEGDGKGDGDGGEGEDDDEDEEGESEAEDGAEGDDQLEGDERILKQLREQAQQITDRKRLAKDRGFLCWADKEMTSFFPIVLTEDWVKGMVKIKCACLESQGDSIYTVDKLWQGNSKNSKDKAFISLIFEIEGEGLRQLQPGVHTGEGLVRAWKLQRVTRQ